MAIRVITSFSQAGYEQYGRRFLFRFEALFDPRIKLTVYTEGGIPLTALPPGAQTENLLYIPEVTDFLTRNGMDQAAKGRVPRAGWKKSDIDKGYCYRFDAVKFFRKPFAIGDLAMQCEEDILVWLDADTYAFRNVRPELFTDLLGDADVAYIGREPAHSECGFLAFRLPAARKLIREWVMFYHTDSFKQEREWHDSYLFDVARRRHPEINCRSIAPPGARGHAWFQTPLGKCIDHVKGDRKARGYSEEMLSQ